MGLFGLIELWNVRTYEYMTRWNIPAYVLCDDIRTIRVGIFICACNLLCHNLLDFFVIWVFCNLSWKICYRKNTLIFLTFKYLQGRVFVFLNFQFLNVRWRKVLILLGFFDNRFDKQFFVGWRWLEMRFCLILLGFMRFWTTVKVRWCLGGDWRGRVKWLGGWILKLVWKWSCLYLFRKVSCY